MTIREGAFLALAELVEDIEKSERFEVHTVIMMLNGQHGEFDTTILATDMTDDGNCEEHKWTCVLHHSGGANQFKEVEV